MQFLDISHNAQTHYRLASGERKVFFLLNRSGDITFELAGEGAEAFVFAFFRGTVMGQKTLNLVQKHTAPKTTSSFLAQAVLEGEGSLTLQGRVMIEKAAKESRAFQESRGLLLSKEAWAVTEPILEILADDVQCKHAATVAPLSEAALVYAATRGIPHEQASELLTRGFFEAGLERMQSLGVEPAHIAALRERVFQDTAVLAE